MHKNTLLLIAILAVIAALLVGISVGRALTQSQTVEPSPTAPPAGGTLTPTPTRLVGTTCGVTFEYPNTHQAMESTGSGVILTNIQNPENSIIIVCQEQIPRVPLTPDRIETVVLTAATGSASVSANLYHDASPKDGTLIDKLIFTHPKTGQDVFIAGFGPVFQQLLTSLKLL